MSSPRKGQGFGVRLFRWIPPSTGAYAWPKPPASSRDGLDSLCQARGGWASGLPSSPDQSLRFRDIRPALPQIRRLWVDDKTLPACYDRLLAFNQTHRIGNGDVATLRPGPLRRRTP
jgi:hypothetical protein